MIRHIKYTNAQRRLASAARATAMNRDVLYHGSRYARLILKTGTLLRSDTGDKKVCLTRSPEVAAYWALMERDDDEKHGAVLVLDRKSLERRYKIRAIAQPFWLSDEVFHYEAEEEIWDDVIDIYAHLLGLAAQTSEGPYKLPAHRPHKINFYKRYEGQVQNRILKLSAERRSKA
jgi:hypothetical protein